MTRPLSNIVIVANMNTCTLKLTFRERTLIRESIDENLTQVNNLICPDYEKMSGIHAINALKRKSEELTVLKRRMKR